MRAVAFCAIFISHLGIANVGGLGAWGVSVFLVLSGFLMVNSYWHRDRQLVFGVSFSWQKVKRLYPLHIAMMLCAAVVRVYAILLGNETYPKLLLDMSLHTALIQIWIPDSRFYSTLNGVSWYLGACAFAYFCFPLILKKLKKAKSRRQVMRWMACLVATQILISVLAFFIGNPDKNAFLSAQWMTYYCPLTRLLDFGIGCCLGYIYRHKEEPRKKRSFYCLMEGCVCVMILLSWFAYANKTPLLGSEYVRYSLLFIGTTAVLIWLVAVNRGVVSRILSWKPLCWIGDISPYAFLIHFIVIKYLRMILNDLHIQNILTLTVTSAAATICATLVWMRLEKRFTKRRYMK